MKKYTILPILALALGFAACDDVDLGTGIPVVNPELPAAGADLVTVTAAAPAVINLADYYTSGENVPVATAAIAEGWPEGYGLGAVAQLSATDDFANPVEVPMLVAGDKFEFNPTELNAAVRQNFSKDPSVEQTLYVRYSVSAVKGNESILLGGPDTFYCPMTVVVTVVPPFEIEESYYYAWSDTPDGWSVNNTQLLAHQGEGNVYDNAIFSSVVTTVKGSYWKIIPASVLDNSDFASAIGVVAADAEEATGSLDRDAATQAAGVMTVGGAAEMTIDLDKLTYSYKEAISNFWLAGNGVNGTSWNDGQFAMVLWTSDYLKYAGYANLYGADQPEFKFSPTNAWSGDFGVAEALEFTTDPNTGVVSASGSATGGNNIKVPAPGLYFITLNYGSPKREVVITGIKTVGVIGDFNGWGASEAMTPSADNLTWKVTVNMNAGQSWKFRMNDGWDINLGGSLDNLTCFGNPANLSCAEDGTYEITLYLGTIPYTATMVKK